MGEPPLSKAAFTPKVPPSVSKGGGKKTLQIKINSEFKLENDDGESNLLTTEAPLRQLGLPPKAILPR